MANQIYFSEANEIIKGYNPTMYNFQSKISVLKLCIIIIIIIII